MAGITQFLEHAFTMPTTVFSVLMVLVVLYWSASLFGIFNLEMLEGVEGLSEGAAEGLAEGLTEGAAEGLADGADGLAADDRPGFLAKTGFSDLPRSITGSLVIFFAWGFSMLGAAYVPIFGTIATVGLVAVASLALAVLGLAVLATSVAIQPLRRLLLAGAGVTCEDLVGRVCIVRTQRVNDAFGQAELEDGSAILQVRNSQDSYFERGERALIYEYDPAKEVFYIIPIDATGLPVDRAEKGAG